MAARAPGVEEKRNYKDSAEYINGVPPAVDQMAFAEDINDHSDTLLDHKMQIDGILQAEHDFVKDFDAVYKGVSSNIAVDINDYDFVAIFDAEYNNPEN